MQSTRPQSLAYAMMDSPVGTAAWIVEKFAAWSDLEKSPSGEHDLESRYTKDQLLTNIMIYLVTRSFGTASWLYRGFFEDGPREFPPKRRVEVPVGIADFPGTRCSRPRRAASSRSPITSGAGARCREAATSQHSRNRSSSSRTSEPSRAIFGKDSGTSPPKSDDPPV